MKKKIDIGKCISWGKLQELRKKMPDGISVTNDFDGEVYITGDDKEDAWPILNEVFGEGCVKLLNV